jgi:hypothetical protein
MQVMHSHLGSPRLEAFCYMNFMYGYGITTKAWLKAGVSSTTYTQQQLFGTTCCMPILKGWGSGLHLEDNPYSVECSVE